MMKPFFPQRYRWSFWLLLGSSALLPPAMAQYKVEPASNTVIQNKPSMAPLQLASDDTQSWPLPTPLSAPKAKPKAASASASASAKAAAPAASASAPVASASAGASTSAVSTAPPATAASASAAAGGASSAPASSASAGAAGSASAAAAGSTSGTTAGSASGVAAASAPASAAAASPASTSAAAGASNTGTGAASAAKANGSASSSAHAAGTATASTTGGTTGTAGTGTSAASAGSTSGGNAATGTAASAGSTSMLDTVLGPNSYDRILRQEEFAGLSRAVVLQMQRELAQIYRNYPDWERDFSLPKQPLEDGIVGPITLFWLQRFCFNFKVAPVGEYSRTLPQSISRIAAFGKIYPQELAILLSSGFAYWDDNQGEPGRSGDFRVRAHGNDAQLLELVARYRASKKSPENNKTADGREGMTLDVWTLSAADLETLGGKDQVVLALKPLSAKTFDSNEALKVAVKQALGGNKLLLDKFWPDIEGQIVTNYGYQVDKDSLANLRKQNLPETLLTALESLNADYFSDKTAFESALAAVMKNLAPEMASYVPQIEEYTAEVDSVGLNAQALTNLKKMWQGNVYNLGVPAVVLNLLKQIQDVSYPELRLFQAAARSKLQYGLGACKMNNPQGNQYIASLRISDDDMAALQKVWESVDTGAATRSGAVDVSTVFGRLTGLRARQTICDKDELKQMTGDVEQLYKAFLLPVVDSVAKKQYPFTSSSMPILWNGNNCGCVLDHLAGLVYGFYPFWANTGKAQPMNFSVLNRVAYYGLSFDDLGEIKQTNDQTGGDGFVLTDGSESANKFILEAQTHSTKVDWVIQRDDWNGAWRSYPQARKRAILKKLADNIMTLLKTRLTDPFSRVKPVISLGTSSPTTRGDGVTLYFSGFPADGDSVDSFNEFFGYLKKGLSGTRAWVNLLVSQSALAEKDGAFGIANLVKLYKVTQTVENTGVSNLATAKGYFLVLVEEPSTDAKKRMRLDIENEPTLRGLDRADFLRRVVPVLQFDQRNWQQLDDDIVYFKDNFAGVGFWPLPLANLAKPVPDLKLPITDPAFSCANAELVALCLMQRYQDEEARTTQVSSLQHTVCEHRWALRASMDLFVLLDVLVLIMFFQSCAVQGFIREYFLPVLALLAAPPLVIFTLLLFYDPNYSRLSQGNVPFIIAVALIFLGTIGGYLYLRSQREKPSRQRALPQRQKSRAVQVLGPAQRDFYDDDDDEGTQAPSRLLLPAAATAAAGTESTRTAAKNAPPGAQEKTSGTAVATREQAGNQAHADHQGNHGVQDDQDDQGVEGNQGVQAAGKPKNAGPKKRRKTGFWL